MYRNGTYQPGELSLCGSTQLRFHNSALRHSISSDSYIFLLGCGHTYLNLYADFAHQMQLTANNQGPIANDFVASFLFSQITTPVLIINREKAVVVANSAFLSLTRWSAQDVQVIASKEWPFVVEKSELLRLVDTAFSGAELSADEIVFELLSNSGNYM